MSKLGQQTPGGESAQVAGEPTVTIRPARVEDCDQLTALINAAYRGDSARRGWTHEADLIDGQRLDLSMLETLLRQPGAAVLAARMPDGRCVGCVAVERQPGSGRSTLGMLSVSPDRQGSGLGRRLIAAAEAEARLDGADTISMTVIAIRTDLIAWYGRCGYKATGERAPFPTHDVRFGTPRVGYDLTFAVLEKPLA